MGQGLLMIEHRAEIAHVEPTAATCVDNFSTLVYYTLRFATNGMNIA
jgi:hypothetical protein